MIILALLLALAMDRIAIKSYHWQAQHYARRYFEWLDNKSHMNSSSSSFKWLMVVVAPAAVCLFLLESIPSTMAEFALQVLILFICLGSQSLKALYKCFLQAANRGDYEACYLYSQQMGHCESKPDKAATFGLQLVWLNYQHYAGVVLWFVAFEAPGAVLYVLVREAFQFCADTSDYSPKKVHGLRHFVDWIPVRITAFGMLLVGNFAHGLPVWLSTLFLVKQAPITTLTRVSAAAEVLPDKKARTEDPTREPTTLVKLAKRNMMFLLVAVSLLTMAGVM